MRHNLVMVNIYKHTFTFGTARGSNPGPFDPKSDTLTTTPPPPSHIGNNKPATTSESQGVCWLQSVAGRAPPRALTDQSRYRRICAVYRIYYELLDKANMSKWIVTIVVWKWMIVFWTSDWTCRRRFSRSQLVVNKSQHGLLNIFAFWKRAQGLL